MLLLTYGSILSIGLIIGYGASIFRRLVTVPFCTTCQLSFPDPQSLHLEGCRLLCLQRFKSSANDPSIPDQKHVVVWEVFKFTSRVGIGRSHSLCRRLLEMFVFAVTLTTLALVWVF